MSLYAIEFHTSYCYKESSNLYYMNNTYHVVANDVEEGIKKIKEKIWKFIDGVKSNSEIRVNSVIIKSAKILQFIDIK